MRQPVQLDDSLIEAVPNYTRKLLPNTSTLIYELGLYLGKLTIIVCTAAQSFCNTTAYT